MTDELDTLAPDRGGRGTEGRVQEFPLGLVAAGVLIVPFGAQLHGWAIAEGTGAAAARVRIRDGRDATGSVMAPIVVPANGSSVEWLGEAGMTAETGLFLEVVSGSVEATIFAEAPTARRR